ATTAFGQGVSVTPIQQVMAMSAIANGGLLMKPHVAKEFLNHDTHQVVQTVQPEVVRRVVSAETAAKVRQTLESVVARGTGKNAYAEGYRVAGKTGTAQVAEHGRYSSSHYIVSFIGMAPANDPKLVAYVAIDHPRPRQSAVFGGTIAAPIVGRLLADSLAYLGVHPSQQGLSKKRSWNEPAMVTVPNLIGLSIGEAQRKTMTSGLNLKTQVIGTGKYIVSQAPAGGSKVPEGSTVRLFLGDAPPGGSGN
ncbi:MAG: PASTA domain-containing protein, partial [Alicyclobacillus shizuokensis]|nr:PASTA domain-containing protein [Alicyclobacillus shizuokensis]